MENLAIQLNDTKHNVEVLKTKLAETTMRRLNCVGDFHIAAAELKRQLKIMTLAFSQNCECVRAENNLASAIDSELALCQHLEDAMSLTDEPPPQEDFSE